ncbi:MAG: M1 family metallopeptidase [Bacteroidetes bacterium]|jgi:hypothetical protein|nr:M1 family metallopeptidase [Bacteroidota bacterium]
MIKKGISLIWGLNFLLIFQMNAQVDRWQQRAEYQMEIDMNVETHQFTGKQSIKYFNNSPDDLNRVFYHLYFNAFQPGSMMDVRSRTITDADPRVNDRISKLKPNEIGYHKIKSLKHNGKDVKYEVVGTILEVELKEAIPGGGTATFDMEFESQVPIQIRRSGRDNKEGISYSMAQWYPKMCEYDYQGWHANPYVGREYYGIWSDFDVKISIDKKYIIGGTGYLQNPEKIGHGYQKNKEKVKHSGKKLTWHFKAPNVHDFMWAADPDYKHISYERDNGMTMHFFFQPGKRTTDNWEMLPKIMDEAFELINKTYGEYPYKQYTFIQGGDGGMEYPMGTLITGERTLVSLVGVSVHELMHSWYQMILGTNESLYAWMDEGFTSYASSEVMNYLKKQKLIPGKPADFIHAGSNGGWVRLSQTGMEEPLTTHADHFQTNRAYSMAAYVKGAAFLTNLSYVIGQETFDKGMLRYFDTWKFKHPNVNDFIRVMEKESGLELDWFKEYMVNSTHTIDYSIKSVEKFDKKQTKISLERKGKFPMPIDVKVTYKKGKTETFTIPLRMMRGEKKMENGTKLSVLEDWPWTHPTYDLILNQKNKKVEKIEIDPSKRMGDANLEDNSWKK